MNTQREQLIQQWVSTVLKTEQFDIQFLAGDASFRRYARINSNDKAFMLMDAPPEKEDCLPFVNIDEFFDKNGVRVPHIYAKDLQQGFLLLEDFGDVLLSTLINHDTVDAYYHQCFKQLVQLQSIAADEILPAYSYEKLMSEMQLLVDWMLPALAVEPSADEIKMIETSFDFLAKAALAQPQVIVHRDFHSRNLMKVADDVELGVIDFQDAVIGADTYDLISLTRDAYVQWPIQQVHAWFQTFYDLLPETSKQQRNFEQFKRDADLMAIQRHIKILGIFVRLFERDGKAGYLNDLPRVMWYLCTEAQPYAELQSFLEFVEQRLMPAFTEKYGQFEAITA